MAEKILSEYQVNCLARGLARCVIAYFKDPKHEAEFQQWLKERELEKK